MQLTDPDSEIKLEQATKQRTTPDLAVRRKFADAMIQIGLMGIVDDEPVSFMEGYA